MVEQFSDNIFYKIICSNNDLGGSPLAVVNDKWIRYNANTDVWYTSKNRNVLSLLKNEIKYSTDILFINGIYSLNFNLIPLLFFNKHVKIVCVRGMLHPGALSQKPFKKKIYISLWKLLRLYKKCNFHASNEEEKRYIQNIFGKKVTIFVAQNFPRINKKQILSKKKISHSLNLVSIALISPMKNHLLVLKALAKSDTLISYDIYGPIKDKEYWAICLDEIKKQPVNINVTYHGDIPPTEVDAVLAKSHVFILPSKSENFGHAIYEALSAGIPVITSNYTPWGNLEKSKSGINVSNENSDEIVEAIKFFAMMNLDEFEQWSVGANQYAINSINLDDIKLQYKKMFFA